MAVDPGTTTLITAYTLTSLSFLIIFARIFLRWIKKEPFKPDDWVMIAAIPVYAADTMCYQVLIPTGNNIVAHPELLTQKQIDMRVFGSKFSLAGRTFYLTYVWMLKTCILIYSSRLTSKTGELKLVKFAGILLVLTWIGSMLATYLPCRPFSGYFQVYPAPPPECSTAAAAVITMGSTNIATDLLLMYIPLPIILRARLPLKTKIQLCCIFLIGFFVITISVIRMVVVLQNNTLINKLLWAQLECFSGTIVANAPIIYSLYKVGRQRVQNSTFRSAKTSSNGISNGMSKAQAQEHTSSTIKLSPAGMMNSDSDSQWQILSDEGGASRKESDETFPEKILSISRTVEVRQNSTEVSPRSGDVRRGSEVQVAIYSGTARREEWEMSGISEGSLV